MSEVLISLTKWFSELPQWLQIAATLLFEGDEFTEDNVAKIKELCKKEVDGELLDKATSFSFPDTAFSQGAEGSLRLCSIRDIEGINALAPQKPLEFGEDNITVVYGNNGSGKSSYVRLLKHVCGARNLSTLYRNVYKPSFVAQKAHVSFERNGSLENYEWLGEGICKDLSSINIFDSSFGKVFVNGDEVSYEPPLLSFFDLLIMVSGKIATALDTEADQHQSRKPNMPADKKVTPEGLWYENISAETTPQDINEHCSFCHTEETKMQILQQRLTEQAPAEKAKQLTRLKEHIDTLINDAQRYMEQLSDENCQRIIAAKKKAIINKKVADTAAEKVFSDSELEGLSSDIWKELWEAARKYSTLIAYKENEYPNVSKGSRCVLCHHPLTQEAKDRLISFESFVKGKTQKAATDAAKEYETASKTVEELPTSEELKTRVDAAGILQNEIASQVMEFFTQLRNRKDQLLEISSEEVDLAPLLSPKWIEWGKIHSKSLGQQVAEYEKDAKGDNMEEIEKRLKSLQTKKWLSEHRTFIDEEVDRLKLLNLIQKARKLTNTKALSEKKGELAEILITDEFMQRFETELKTLGASQVKVQLVKSRVSKGRVLHKIQLRGASQGGLTDVLSEGENRIVSIAAFLADVTGKSQQSPLIFDDPISSLDQNYGEALVQRLCGLSLERQVILFTHRLSLLVMVQDCAKKLGVSEDIVYIRQESWGAGEPGSLPIHLKRPDRSLNELINENLPKARKIYRENIDQEYEHYAKGLCSDFRILLERMIESELLGDVVQRFRRSINTLGKLEKLAKVSEADCKYFDNLMTKYSRYEHSQPLEVPIALPTLDEFEKDFKELKNWQESFKNRTTTVKQ